MTKSSSMRAGTIVAAAAIMLALSPETRASQAKSGDLAVTHAQARATVGTARPGAVYLTVTNTGRHADALVGAESDVATRTELHTIVRDGAVMRMQEVPEIAVPANGKAELKPGGYHIMLMGLRRPLDAGTSFDITLRFRAAGAVTARVTVVPLGNAPGHSGGHGSHGH